MKILKSVLEFLAIVAYIPVTTYLCYTVGVRAVWTVFGPPRSYTATFILWVGLIASGALVLFKLGRKAAGWIMAAAAFIAAMISYVVLSGILPGI